MANKIKDRPRGKKSPGWREPLHEVERLVMRNTTLKVPDAMLAAADRLRVKLAVTNRVDVMRRAIAVGLFAIDSDTQKFQEAGTLILDDVAAP